MSGLTPTRFRIPRQVISEPRLSGTIVGPGVINFDTALYKDFHIKGESSIQFRAEAFNVLNHTPIFTVCPPRMDLEISGTVTSALDPRIFEFALRIHF